MTGLRITVTDRELREALRGIALVARDPSPFLRPLGLQLIR